MRNHITTTRKQQISLVDTPNYLCISCYVKLAFLGSEDNVTRQKFEHRRAWLEYKHTVPSELKRVKSTSQLPELGDISISLIKQNQQSQHAVDKLAEFIQLRLKKSVFY